MKGERKEGKKGKMGEKRRKGGRIKSYTYHFGKGGGEYYFSEKIYTPAWLPPPLLIKGAAFGTSIGMNSILGRICRTLVS